MLKKKWVRWVLVLGILFFVVIPITLLLIAWTFIDPIGEKLIEAGGTEALGVTTEVGSFHCSILSGSVAINNMKIDNPQGFDAAKKALNLELVSTGVSIGSLTSDTIDIHEMTIDGLTVYLESNDKTTNVQTLLKRVQGDSNAGVPPAEGQPAAAPAQTSSAEKRFRIDVIHLAHIKMELRTTWPVDSKNSFEIPAFEMRDLKQANGEGYTAGELLAEILNRTTQAGLKIGQDGLQAAIKERLMAELNKAGEKFQNQASAAAKQAGEDLKRDAGKAMENELNNALTGDKKDGDKPDPAKDVKKDLGQLKNPFK